MPRIVEIVDSTNNKQSRWLKIGNNSIIDFSRVQLKPKTDGRFDIWKYKSSCGNSGQKCITHQLNIDVSLISSETGFSASFRSFICHLKNRWPTICASRSVSVVVCSQIGVCFSVCFQATFPSSFAVAGCVHFRVQCVEFRGLIDFSSNYLD